MKTEFWGGLLWNSFVEFLDNSINSYILEIRNESLVFLELGAREGDLSEIYKDRFQVICSDISYSEVEIKRSTFNFEYKKIDCLNIDLPSETIDVIVFKSVFGGLKTLENQCRAYNEMYRILKPNGIIIFAENCTGSAFHNFLRFIKNKSLLKYWKYFNYSDFLNIIGKTKFEIVEISFLGVLSGLFNGNKFINKILIQIDEKFLYRFIKYDKRTLVFGCIKKL